MVVGLELLSDALALRHLPDQQLQHGIGLLVDPGEVGSELALGDQLRIDMPLGAFQISCVCPPEAANHRPIRLRIFLHGRP